VVGWIKRGPTGLIGTNKSDARETTLHMIADAATLLESAPRQPAKSVESLLSERKLRAVSFADWRRLDELEQSAGKKLGKIREKFYSCKEMLVALDGSSS
jgi:ferredoxin--NADP+ reductase